jgi:hypothetical protein
MFVVEKKRKIKKNQAPMENHANKNVVNEHVVVHIEDDGKKDKVTMSKIESDILDKVEVLTMSYHEQTWCRCLLFVVVIMMLFSFLTLVKSECTTHDYFEPVEAFQKCEVYHVLNSSIAVANMDSYLCYNKSNIYDYDCMKKSQSQGMC